MKNKFYTPMLSGLILLFSLTLSCKRDKTPTPVAIFTPSDPVSDVEGNVYQTVKIGNQIWTTGNLRSTKFNDGSSIPYVDVQANWVNLNTPAFVYYAFDSANKPTYGALYNYYAATDPKIAPAGWHVPTAAEWQTLILALGVNAGDKLKEMGTTHWQPPVSNATNESGLTVLPGGFIDGGDGSFNLLFYTAAFWTSTETNATNATVFQLVNTNSTVSSTSYYKSNGYSLRLVKD
jgi:uncharacterized protein (TIGR02145 family)